MTTNRPDGHTTIYEALIPRDKRWYQKQRYDHLRIDVSDIHPAAVYINGMREQ